MNENFTQVNIKGRPYRVPAIDVSGRTIVVTGKWLKKATAKDEEVVEGGVVSDPDSFLAQLRGGSLKPDILTFPDDFRHPREPLRFYWESDNLAVLPLTSYEDWERALSQDTRRNIRKSIKAGVAVRTVEFDDELLRGIKALYDETPVRQGRRFWHYGKDLEAIRVETATFPERSEFIAAYHGQSLVGFIKLIYTDDKASVIHFITSGAHYDKRPANALIAKAVEVSIQRSMHYLIYRKYIYGKNTGSSLTEFKRRNGFQEVRFPRYYAALTLRGQVALRLRMHRSYKEFLPEPVTRKLLAFRAWILEGLFDRLRRPKRSPAT
jgi:hypothetical protein